MAFRKVAEKFRSLAGYAVTAKQAERIIAAVERTETLDNIHELTGFLDNHFILQSAADRLSGACMSAGVVPRAVKEYHAEEDAISLHDHAGGDEQGVFLRERDLPRDSVLKGTDHPRYFR